MISLLVSDFQRSVWSVQSIPEGCPWLGWVKNFFALWCNGLTVEKVDVIGFGGQIGDFLLDNENCISLFYRSIGPRSACLIPCYLECSQILQLLKKQNERKRNDANFVLWFESDKVLVCHILSCMGLVVLLF